MQSGHNLTPNQFTMAPDPPTVDSDSPIRCPNNIQNQVNTSDESEDNEELNRHEGYEPLNMNENLVNDTIDNSVMDQDEENNVPERAAISDQCSRFTADLDMMDEIQDLNVGCKGDEEPISVEAEVMAEVWNQPRPAELNFELDVNSQELVSNFFFISSKKVFVHTKNLTLRFSREFFVIKIIH